MKHKLLLIALVACSIVLPGITGCSADSSDYYYTMTDTTNGGTGGSMARFTIYNNYLFTVDYYKLNIVSLSNPAVPEHLKSINIGVDIETIFAYNEKLFIGSQSGMYIYDISSPEFPTELAHVSHLTSCDPVVAYGKYAYVTLNMASTNCFRGRNELVIYNVSDLRAPVTVRTLTMNSPKGLAVDGERNLLFVCDKGFGVKMYDISEPETEAWPKWIGDLTNSSETKDINAYDVIAIDGLLIVSAEEGIFLVDYSGNAMVLVSKIS